MVGYNFINKIRVGTGGKFTVYNSLCAAACAIELGIDMSVIFSALLEMHGVKGRAEVVPTNRDFTVIIDYAHTPDGLENILNTFKEYRECRLVVVFGCGGDRDKTKRPIMGEIAGAVNGINDPCSAGDFLRTAQFFSVDLIAGKGGQNGIG